jgi:hypothetical protein
MVDNSLILLFKEKIRQKKLNLNKKQCIFMAYIVEHLQKNQKSYLIRELKEELENYLGKKVFYSQLYYALSKLLQIEVIELDDFKYDRNMNDICMDSRTEVKLIK